jgi:hypothetical protein
MSQPTKSIALLLHVARWEATVDHVDIAPNIVIGRFANSRFETLYHRLCIERGLDDGEPLGHGAYALMEPAGPHELFCGGNDPYATIERLANVIVVVSSYALTYSREIWSADGFRSALLTEETHQACGQQDFLQRRPLVFTDERLAQLQRAWGSVDALWQAEKCQSRIIAALGHFHQAWRAHGMEHTCLHLATLVDVLFALPHQGDTAHQASLTLARFAGRDRGEREALYDLLQRFYGVRAAILQGGNGQDDGFIDTTVTMFHRMAAILERILTEQDLAGIFNSPSQRHHLLMECLLHSWPSGNPTGGLDAAHAPATIRPSRCSCAFVAKGYGTIRMGGGV